MFELLKTDASSKARLGRLTTTHGVVDTPVFMSVGTQGSVKAIDPRELREMGTQIILGNTYHLNIRPGLDIIRAAGGLHRFINWPRPDPDRQRRVPGVQPGDDPQDPGARRRVPLAPGRLAALPRAQGGDGHPEHARLGHRDGVRRLPAAHQHAARAARRRRAHDALGRANAANSRARRARWSSASCRAAPTRRLREECAKALVALKFDGYAIGGVSVGEPEPEMMRAVEMTEPLLPADQPRYAMGLGTPAQMVELVARGVDMFDCVLPTRVARNGTAFTRKGSISIKAGACKADFRPIEEGCDCFACRHFTRAYLRHLLNVGEILGLRMLSVHNTRMYLRTMAEMRAAIAAGTFAEFRREFVANYVPTKKVLLARAAEAER